MLISQVRTELVGAGFDPSIGFAHRHECNRIPLVYDAMEPLCWRKDEALAQYEKAPTLDLTSADKAELAKGRHMSEEIVCQEFAGSPTQVSA